MLRGNCNNKVSRVQAAQLKQKQQQEEEKTVRNVITATMHLYAKLNI